MSTVRRFREIEYAMNVSAVSVTAAGSPGMTALTSLGVSSAVGVTGARVTSIGGIIVRVAVTGVPVTTVVG